jgi:hypothetical protein
MIFAFTMIRPFQFRLVDSSGAILINSMLVFMYELFHIILAETDHYYRLHLQGGENKTEQPDITLVKIYIGCTKNLVGVQEVR